MDNTCTLPKALDAQEAGGRLVYLPLDRVPKELLERLGNYKLFTMDNRNGQKSPIEDVSVHISKTSTEAHDHHRVSVKDGHDEEASKEHIASDRPKTTSPVITRTPPISPDTTLNVPTEGDIFTFDPLTLSSTFPHRTSHEKTRVDIHHLTHETKDSDFAQDQIEREIEHPPSLGKPPQPHHNSQMYSQTYHNNSRLRHPVSRQPSGIHADAQYSEIVSGRRPTSVVSSDIDERLQTLKNMLEKTPNKEPASEGNPNLENIPRTPRRSRCVSWAEARRLSALREMPCPPEHQYYSQTPRARKQLFEPSPVEYMEMGYFDSNEVRGIAREYSPQYRDQRMRRPMSSRPMQDLVGYLGNSDGQENEYDTVRYVSGQKRKVPFDDGFTSPRKSCRIRQSSDAHGNLFEFLQPSKRHCYDEDIGPEPETAGMKINCACAIMESNFLQMTQCAYKNIRRKDSSAEGFEQFKRELAQTNDLLKQSVTLLTSIQQICRHRPQAS